VTWWVSQRPFGHYDALLRGKIETALDERIPAPAGPQDGRDLTGGACHPLLVGDMIHPLPGRAYRVVINECIRLAKAFGTDVQSMSMACCTRWRLRCAPPVATTSHARPDISLSFPFPSLCFFGDVCFIESLAVKISQRAPGGSSPSMSQV
jgi:hypothetical protein